MKSDEALWREFVLAYEVDVPEGAVEAELDVIKMDMRHRMRYDQMSGGDVHLFPERELAEQADELYALALFEAKEPRVLSDVIATQGLTATPEELRSEAEALVAREHSTLEMVQRFFGEDFAGLRRDVLNAKARAWACERMRTAPEPLETPEPREVPED